MEGPTPNDKDTYNIELNAALTHIKLAKTAEANDKYELAMKHYLGAANKLMEILKSETDENKKKVYTKHITESITQAGILKAVISDKKN